MEETENNLTATNSESTQEKESKTITNTTKQTEGLSPTFGRRNALKDIRRQLTEDELANPGVQKLLIEMLEEADDVRQSLLEFENRFYESDKKAAILSEQLKNNTRIEVFFGVGIGLGCSIIGLTPFFMEINHVHGYITLALGVCITIGSVVGRVKK